MCPAEARSRPEGEDARRSSVSLGARLPSESAACGAARRQVRTRLAHVVEPALLDDVLLVVSELVTNAVRHGRGDVELRVAFDGERVTGRVADEGRSFARRARERPADAIGGYGLQIVEQVAAGWGIGGEAADVWFEIAGGRAAGPVH